VSRVRNAVSWLKKIPTMRLKTSHSTLAKTTAVLLILVIAFLIRLLPIRWGYYLNEFDPYYHYRQTKYIVENGIWGQNGWITWHDYLSWYPWGNEIQVAAYPGLPVTAAVLYKIVSTLGIPLSLGPTLDPLLSDPIYILCVIFPVIMGTLACLVIYFLGKDIGGPTVGLLSALFLALDSSYIGRTGLGFFDDESIGILSILLFSIFLLRSIEESRPLRSSLIYAIAGGLTMGYLFASWGAAKYPILMAALFALALLIIGRYSSRLLLSNVVIVSISLSIASTIPRLNPAGSPYILAVEIIPVYGVIFLLCIAEINRRAKSIRGKLIIFAALTCLLAAFLGFLWWRGMIGALGEKFLAVLDPFVRFQNPIVESVAEHRPSAWGTFYYNWGVGTFFIPVGLFFTVMSATNPSIFLIIYGLTSIYFASSMIRLNIIISPVVSLLWAFAIVRLLKPFIIFLREPSQTSRQRTWSKGLLGKETAASIVVLIFILLTLTYVTGTDFIAPPTTRTGPRVYSQAYTPTQIAASGTNVMPSDTVRDWLDALTWIRENLPPSPEKPGEPGTVIASWWDYGYWITTIANRTTLADNGTWNLTQIKQIGLMFMSNETEAIKILGRYNVTHVVIFTTFDTNGAFRSLGGDEGKWQWMAKIPGLNSTSFGNYTLGWNWSDLNGDGRAYDSSGNAETNEFSVNSKGQNSTIYKLMAYGKDMTLWGYSYVTLEHFEKAYFSESVGSGSSATIPGQSSYVALVCVYKVNYSTNS
jgi:dolichyl-diphosphooligosaccharide--protein glycosyltransferase